MDKIVFQFNNVGKPYLLIKVIEDGKVKSTGRTEFSRSQLEDNLPLFDESVEAINEFINRKNVERKKAVFLINAMENTKITTTIPNMAERKLKKMYETELSSKLPNINDYDGMSVVSNGQGNKIFYEYIVDTKYRKFFEKIAETLGFEEVEVDYINSYLFSEITNNIKKKTFAYIYEEYGVSFLEVVIDGQLCAFSSFVANQGEYNLNVVSIIDKHIYGLEKAKIDTLYTNKDIECLEALNPIVNKYIIGGTFDEN